MKSALTKQMSAAAVALACFCLPGMSNAQRDSRPAANDYENPPSLPVAQVIDSSYLSGKTYRLTESADADGMLYSFSLWTPFGWYRPQSIAMLQVRMIESQALAALTSMKDDPLFLEGITDSARNTVRSTANAVTQPLKTLRSVPMGLEKFGRGVQARVEQGPVTGESGRMRDMGAKRKLAADLGVDPYTDNPQLQEALNTVANHKNAGAITAKLASMAVGGGTGVAIRAAQMNKKLQAKLRDNSAPELQKANRAAMLKLGCPQAMVDSFLELGGYTATRTTGITDAMADLAGVRNLPQYLSSIGPASAPEVSLYHQQQIEMAANYHNTVHKLVSFSLAGKTGVFTDGQGDKHIFAPVDVMYWSPELNERVRMFNPSGNADARIHVWITGTVTDKARENLAKAGITVHERSAEKLLAFAR